MAFMITDLGILIKKYTEIKNINSVFDKAVSLIHAMRREQLQPTNRPLDTIARRCLLIGDIDKYNTRTDELQRNLNVS